MSRRRLRCECGCKQMVYSNHLTEVTIEEHKDDTMRETVVVKRFRVTKECERPFTQELELQQFLKILAIRWRPKPKTLLQRINLVRTAWRYARRVKDAHKVMRLTHGIHERSRMLAMGKEAGFKWTKDHSIRTAVLFGAPVFMQGFLHRRFLLRAVRRQVKIDAAPPPIQEAARAA